MTTSSEKERQVDTTCDCNDKQHTDESELNHKHIDDDCVHDDGTRHKIVKS
jgi:hypothetical protein